MSSLGKNKGADSVFLVLSRGREGKDALETLGALASGAGRNVAKLRNVKELIGSTVATDALLSCRKPSSEREVELTHTTHTLHTHAHTHTDTNTSISQHLPPVPRAFPLRIKGLLQHLQTLSPRPHQQTAPPLFSRQDPRRVEE